MLVLGQPIKSKHKGLKGGGRERPGPSLRASHEGDCFPNKERFFRVPQGRGKCTLESPDPCCPQSIPVRALVRTHGVV